MQVDVSEGRTPRIHTRNIFVRRIRKRRAGLLPGKSNSHARTPSLFFLFLSREIFFHFSKIYFNLKSNASFFRKAFGRKKKKEIRTNNLVYYLLLRYLMCLMLVEVDLKEGRSRANYLFINGLFN